MKVTLEERGGLVGNSSVILVIIHVFDNETVCYHRNVLGSEHEVFA